VQKHLWVKRLLGGKDWLRNRPGSGFGGFVIRGGLSMDNQINLAGIGVGGVGRSQLRRLKEAGFNIVALCDVDDVYARDTYSDYPQARTYRDFREMLENEGDKIDAVYIATPDHTHAVIALEAIKRRKHVLCVKPLARTVYEARVLAAREREAGVCTQMTAASAVGESGCRICELIWEGVIGDVYEVDIWSDRPWWPQGMLRPTKTVPVPETFDWDLWLGPAPERPFMSKWPDNSLPVVQTNWKHTSSHVYHPFNFRGWYDFGTGSLGDMGCHYFNTPRRALKLGYPVAVTASSTKVMEETWPLAAIVTWEFSSRAGMVPVKVVWYDGGLKPSRPLELDPDRPMPGSGVLYVGTKGTIMVSEEDKGLPRILPESGMKTRKLPPETLPRRKDVYNQWFEAIQGGEAPSQTWHTCAAPLTELVLLGNVAIRMEGLRLEYDGVNMRFTNSEEATELLKPEYHNGWSLEG